MDDVGLLMAIEDLVVVKTKVQLSQWIEEHLLARWSPSSILVAVCNIRPGSALVPYFVTPSFPMPLLKAFNMEDICFSIPLLKEWLESGYTEVSEVEGDGQQQDMLWRTLFKQKGFEIVAVAASIDPHEEYISYLCITDPKVGDVRAPAEDLRRQLSIISRILANVLFQLQREEAQAQRSEEIDKLTPREREILGWIKKGKTNFEISSILGVAFPTIKNHVQRILIKLQVNNRTQAISKISSSRTHF